MAMKCENCNKGMSLGHRVSHSKRRTNHAFKPNLQHTKILVNGSLKRMKLCTKCIKVIRKREKDAAAKVSAALQAGIHSQSPLVS